VVALLSFAAVVWLGHQAARWRRTWDIDGRAGRATLTLREPHESCTAVECGALQRVAFQRERMPSGVADMGSVLIVGTLGHIRLTGFPETSAPLAANQLANALDLPFSDRVQQVGCTPAPSKELLAG